jgi:hypothetical protein
MRRIGYLAAMLLVCAGLLAGTGNADPTKHWTDSFTIVCGGHNYVIVSKPGSSNVITIDGQPSNSVSILFGLHVVDDQGNVFLDFRKPGAASAKATVCTDTSWPPGWTATAWTLLTPAH